VSSAHEQKTGEGFVFDTGIKLVERQLEWIDRLDTKLGTLWALISGALVWSAGFAGSSAHFGGLVHLESRSSVLANRPFLVLFAIAEMVLLAAFVYAVIALFPRRSSMPVHFESFLALANRAEDTIKAASLDTLRQAHCSNAEVINTKGRLLKSALVLASGAVILIVFALASLNLPS
jgi:hypothetical protein